MQTKYKILTIHLLLVLVAVSALGQAPGIHKFGSNPVINIASVPESVWFQGNLYPFPTAAAATNIVSNNTADDGDPTGTGAHTVIVTGYIAGYTQVTETITMNGAVAVPLANNYLRIIRANVDDVGSVGVNVGDITITIGGVIVANIGAGLGQTQLIPYTIPTGFTGDLRSISCSIRGANATKAEALLLSRDGPLKSWRVRENLSIQGNGGAVKIAPMQPIYFPETSDIDIRITVVSNDASAVDCWMDIQLSEGAPE